VAVDNEKTAGRRSFLFLKAMCHHPLTAHMRQLRRFDCVNAKVRLRTHPLLKSCCGHLINSQALFHFVALQGISPKLRSALFC
jgi:hypothetical protein